MFPTTHTEAGQSCGALTAVQELALVSLTLQIAHRRAPRQPVRRCSCITLRELAGEADPGGFVQLQGSAGRPQPRLASGSPCARCLLPGSTPTEPGTGSPPPVPGWSAAELSERVLGPPSGPAAPSPAAARPAEPRSEPAAEVRGPAAGGRAPPRPGRRRALPPALRGGSPAGAWRGLGPSGLPIPPARNQRPGAVGSAGLGRLRGTAEPERSRAGSPRPLSRARGRPEERCAAQRSPVPSPTKAPLCWPRNC